MTVLCDASPLIFLAKLERLELLALLGQRIVVLKCVADEILSERATVRESAQLKALLSKVEIIEFHESAYESRTLSRSDRTTLTFAVKHRVDWLVVDERLLRRVAGEEGVQTIGTLGLLTLAVRKGVLSPAEARADLDRAVSSLGFRISSQIYQRVIGELGA